MRVFSVFNPLRVAEERGTREPVVPVSGEIAFFLRRGSTLNR